MTREQKLNFADYIVHLAETTSAKDVADSQAEVRVAAEALERMSREERANYFDVMSKYPKIQSQESEDWKRHMVRHYSDLLVERVRRDVVRMMFYESFDATRIKEWAEEVRGSC